MLRELTPAQKLDIETIGHFKDWADRAAEQAHKYIMSQDGGMSEAAIGNMANGIRDAAWRWLTGELSKIKGGYNYMGACSDQYCFPLKSGGELRFMMVDDDCVDVGETGYSIDLYDGSLPPGISGPSTLTGK